MNKSVFTLMVIAFVGVGFIGCVDFGPLVRLEPGVSEDVLAAAGDSDDTELVAPLIALLKQRNARGESGLTEDQATEVVISLGKRRTTAALPDIINAFQHDTSETVRYHAAAALGRIGEKTTLEPLYQSLINDQEERFVREVAEESLAHVSGYTATAEGFEGKLAYWKQWWETRQKEIK